MGRPKAELDWHGQTFADRIGRVLMRATRGPLVVVAAPGQAPPPLPAGATLVTDAREDEGPLEAIAAGLRALPSETIAYVSSTDVPLLHPAFVERVIAAVDDDVDIAACETDGRLHPLAAAYRTSLLAEIDALLADGQRRPIALFETARTRVLDRDALLASRAVAAFDGELRSLDNVNTPDDYEEALGRELPPVVVERLGLLRAGNGGHEFREQAQAATLGELADVVGIELDEHVVAALNGEQITTDVALPLVAGDRVTFLTADGGG